MVNNKPNIKFLSLHNFWAALMPVGLKKLETRNWYTSWRGWLGIHATAKLEPYAIDCYSDSPLIQEALQTIGVKNASDLRSLPYSSIVCVVNLKRCIPTNKMPEYVQPVLMVHADHSLPTRGTLEYEAGNYDRNRYAWVTEDLRTFDPIPCKGRQGLWTAPPEIERRVMEAAGLLN